MMWYYKGMKEKELVLKRDAIRAAFDNQVKIESDAKYEQLRLQGEYRLINEFIDSLPKKESQDGKTTK